MGHGPSGGVKDIRQDRLHFESLLDPVSYPFESILENGIQTDPKYPGTAVLRLRSVLNHVHSLPDLNKNWPEVRQLLLTAGGLKDDESTSRAFNDDRHCDLTTMIEDFQYDFNADPSTDKLVQDQLRAQIGKASLPKPGPGGSWFTCINGAHTTPPRDVAHTVFRSRIAFKLVWVPPDFTQFVLVDDEGGELKRGKPTAGLPPKHSRSNVYALVQGGKYAVEADAIAAGKPKVCLRFGGETSLGA